MIFSMTGFANATRELLPAAVANDGSSGGATGGATTVSVELRSVNSRFLDLHFRMPDEVRACEPVLREMLTSGLSRGKVEIRVNVQRADSVSSGALDKHALAQLQTLQAAVREAFADAAALSVGEVLRWPGVITGASVDAQALHEAVIACGREAVQALSEMRAREGEALGNMLRDRVADMEAIVARITPLVPELVARRQQEIVERLGDALGILTSAEGSASSSANSAASESGVPRSTLIPPEEVAERIRQEVTVYGIRIDIDEELTRLSAHLSETRHVLDKGGRVGKRLDFMMQELNREANTVGSKAAAKTLADASMALKLLIEQMREQVQNLE